MDANSTRVAAFSKPPKPTVKNLWKVNPLLIGSPFEKIYREAMNDGIAETVTAYFSPHERFYEVSVYPAQNGITIFFTNATARIKI